MEKIRGYLSALESGTEQTELLDKIINELNTYDVKCLSENKIFVAKVFIRLLQYFQKIYKNSYPKDKVDKILYLFTNIENIVGELTENEENDSNIIIIKFLHTLKLSSDDVRLMNEYERKNPELLGILLRELDSIYFIFETKNNDGEWIFPIHEMIFNVVNKTKFIDKNSFDVYHIRMLQLAVKLFNDNIDHKKVLDDLENKCNLRFIDYLSSLSSIIDTQNLLNYQKNHVMIFYNSDKNKILIRHKNESYFKNIKEFDIKIESEKDYKDNIIGYFVEYNLENGDELIDFSKILDSPEGRVSFLNLVYSNNAYNVLLEKAIIKKWNNKYKLVNPFCMNDQFIINGKIKNNYGKVYQKNQLKEALSNYRCSALKISNKNIMNRVSFGLALLLLEREKLSFKALGLDRYREEEWYQIQFIKNWINKCSNPINALEFVIQEWYNETEYCKRIKPKKNFKNIQEHDVCPLDFYPLKSELFWLYEILGYGKEDKVYILKGNIVEDEDIEKFTFNIKDQNNRTNNYFITNSRNSFEINTDNIIDDNDILENIYEKLYIYFI